jgi:hypothetical protein
MRMRPLMAATRETGVVLFSFPQRMDAMKQLVAALVMTAFGAVAMAQGTTPPATSSAPAASATPAAPATTSKKKTSKKKAKKSTSSSSAAKAPASTTAPAKQ